MKNLKHRGPPGQFEGKLIVAMPDMNSDTFSEAVVFMCAHNDDGALGFIINKSAPMALSDLVAHTELAEEEQFVISRTEAEETPVFAGGPVDQHRGFVLHSDEYSNSATLPVWRDLALTSSLQILRAIASGTGPRNAAVFLGYAGWSAGQLEAEMADNAWLVVDAERDFIFDRHVETKYQRALQSIGISSANFISEAGRA